MQLSTATRNQILDTGAIRTIFNLGQLNIYSGTAPLSADDAPTGVLLCTISNASSATGITFEGAAINGTITKNLLEVWSGANLATGVAGYFRIVAAGDTGTLSTVEPRVQGTVGLAGTDLVLASISLVLGATQTVDYFTIAMPAQ